MNRRIQERLHRSLCKVATWLIVCAVSGCGLITDKDRLQVATYRGEPISRGDLLKLIREMPDEDRPLIQTRADLLRTLNKYINDLIKEELSKELTKENRIQVSRDLARQAYFQKHPESLSVYQIHVPEDLGMTEGDVAAMKADIEFKIDDEVEVLLREAALQYKIQEAIKARAVTIEPEDFEREYMLREKELIQFESIDFIAFQFPTQAQNAVQEASRARQRMDAGESFDAVLESYVSDNPEMGMRSFLQNDPTSEKFRPFWDIVTGCSVGDIIGPILLPPYDRAIPRQDGSFESRSMPAALLVLEVLEHTPQGNLSLEDARAEMAATILSRKLLEMLRAERGVEVFPENLPRPEGYGDQYKDQMIKTTVQPG